MTVDPRALRAGAPDALEQLYREHAADVLGWVVRLGGPDLDVEDVAHQVFETALKGVRSFRGESSTRTWLFGVTRGVVANARRRAAVRRWFGLDDAHAGDFPDLDDELDLRRRRRRVQEALERLPAAQREVLVLAGLEERPAAEVAQLLGVPVGTVWSRLSTARRAFAVALDREGLGAEELAEGRLVGLRGAPGRGRP